MKFIKMPVQTRSQTRKLKEMKTKIIKGYNPITNNWHCLECGDNMGPDNSRQLCRKFYCDKNQS